MKKKTENLCTYLSMQAETFAQKKCFFFLFYRSHQHLCNAKKNRGKGGGGERNPHKFLHYKQFIFEQ